MKKKIELIMAVILLVSAGFLAKRGAIYVQQSKVAKTQTCIVIDAVMAEMIREKSVSMEKKKRN